MSYDRFMLRRALDLAGTSLDTPLAAAIREANALREAGVDSASRHKHIGENGVRCEFCGDPVWADKHDPRKLDDMISGSVQ